MKLCFSTLVCPAWNLDQIIEAARASEIGGVDFRGIGDEIDVTKLPAFNENLPETLSKLRDARLALPCLNTSVTLVSPAPERWQMMLEEAHRHVKLAEKTATQFLRIFGGGVPKGMSREEARAMAQRRLRQLTKMCRGSGCRPLLETHDEWATSAQVLELIHEFSPEEVGVLWDIEHPYRRGEAIVDTAAGMKRYIAHVHVKDSVRVEPKNSPRLLGQGELPISDAVRALREIGYEGWYCLETEKRWHAEAPEPDVSIPQFAQFMRQL